MSDKEQPVLLARRRVGISIVDGRSGPSGALIYEEDWRDGNSYYTRVAYGRYVYAVTGEVHAAILEAAVPLVRAIESACAAKDKEQGKANP